MKLPEADVIAYDIETAIGGEIVEYPTMVSCASSEGVYVAVGEESIRSLLLELEKAQKLGTMLVGHNSWSFDVPIINKYGFNLDLGMDTMVMAYFADETQALGLESCAVKYLGVGSWKGTKDDWKHFDPNSAEAAKYAARDAKYTYDLYLALLCKLGSRMATIDKIVKPARHALDKQTERGIVVVPGAVARERRLSEATICRTLQRISEFTSEKFNPNSTKQVGEFLMGRGIKLPLTETGKPSTSVGTLQLLDDEFAKTLLEYRGAVKTLSTYVEPYTRIINNGGRVHPEYTLIRTLTGRSSARNLNVQQLPREFKDFFHVPFEADYSAIEFRIAAWFAQERIILDSFQENPSWDPHRFVAAMFYGKKATEVTDNERQIAKSANFGLLYLGNGYTLYEYASKQGVKMDLETAEEIYRFWHATFPGFKKFYSETKEELKKFGKVEGATGQIRHFGDFSLVPTHKRLECLRQAVNFKVQNLSAHIAYLALARLEQMGIPSIGFVHDSVLFELTNEKDLVKLAPQITSAMVDYPRAFLQEHFGVILNIPLQVEFKVDHKKWTAPGSSPQKEATVLLSSV